MNEENDERFHKAFNAAIDACAPLPPHERLEVLELVWLAFADNARAEELAIPGGFPAEQQRQLECLEKMAALVRDAQPDLEAQKLWLQQDYKGLMRHLRSQDGEDE